jgi:hypothetical protein
VPRKGNPGSPVSLLRRTAKCQNKEEVRFGQTPAAQHIDLRQKTRCEPAAALTVERGKVRNAAVQDRTASPLGPHAGLEGLDSRPRAPES